MKKTIFKITAFVLACGILFFYGCQKNQTNDNPLTEKNVQLVPESVAVSIAEHFNPSDFFNESNPTNNSNIRSTLNGQNKIKTKYLFNDSYGNPALYIFNFENNAGFIFVSADYQMQPILAFVEHGAFKKDTVPSGVVAWVEKTMENIEIVRQGLYDNSKLAAVAWRNYYKQNGNGGIKALKVPPVDNNCIEDKWTATSVGPLLPVTWGQRCSYNDLCPDLSCDLGCSNGRALTGCVATSASQIIKYWHPTNSYNYNYASMTATSGNGEVQRLMSDVGRAINMSYGCGASSAKARNITDVLTSNFGFASANNGEYTWQAVQGNLNNHWPVLLDCCRSQQGHWFIINWWNTGADCHTWVCDGYNQFDFTFCENGQYSGSLSYLYFHMNWGWHELSSNPPNYEPDYNGWFAFNNWNIDGININYQYAQDMMGDIHP